MITNDTQKGTPFVAYTDTVANIEALTGISEGAFAYGTDVDKPGWYDGTDWTWTFAGSGGGGFTGDAYRMVITDAVGDASTNQLLQFYDEVDAIHYTPEYHFPHLMIGWSGEFSDWPAGSEFYGIPYYNLILFDGDEDYVSKNRSLALISYGGGNAYPQMDVYRSRGSVGSPEPLIAYDAVFDWWFYGYNSDYDDFEDIMHISLTTDKAYNTDGTTGTLAFWFDTLIGGSFQALSLNSIGGTIGGKFYIGDQFRMIPTSVDSTPYTITDDIDSNTIFTAAGVKTINLPAVADSNGRIIIIKDINSNTDAITIDGNASETIDGATTKVLNTAYAVARLFCDGSAWYTM